MYFLCNSGSVTVWIMSWCVICKYKQQVNSFMAESRCRATLLNTWVSLNAWGHHHPNRSITVVKADACSHMFMSFLGNKCCVTKNQINLHVRIFIYLCNNLIIHLSSSISILSLCLRIQNCFSYKIAWVWRTNGLKFCVMASM